MLNSTLCPPNQLQAWTTFTGSISRTLANSAYSPIQIALVTLLGASVIWLYWNIQQSHQDSRRWRWKNYWTKAAIAAVIASVLITSPPGIAAATQLLTGLVPSDLGEPAEAIVVLGRGQRSRLDRIEAVTALWRAKRAPKIFASGITDAPLMVKAWKARGIPDEAIDGEGCSRTTEENAQFTAAILRPQGIKRILLVTDPPHLLRSWLTLQSFGFDVIPYGVELPKHLTYRQRAAILFREYGGLVSYGVKGRFFERNPSISLLIDPVAEQPQR